MPAVLREHVHCVPFQNPVMVGVVVVTGVFLGR